MKTVIITGANGNLGTAVTKEFLENNYKVLATVASESAKADINTHPHLEVHVVNLTQEEETNSFIKMCIEKHNTIDSALLLVGGFAAGNISTTTGSDLQKQISLNFETAYFITRPLFAHMKENKKGRIVFI